MRIFHLSDLHIGLKLINRDLREDQEYILDQIIQKAAEKVPDAIVIAGDIYDKAVPSAEAVEVFDHFIGKLRNAVPDSVAEAPRFSPNAAAVQTWFPKYRCRH